MRPPYGYDVAEHPYATNCILSACDCSRLACNPPDERDQVATHSGEAAGAGEVNHVGDSPTNTCAQCLPLLLTMVVSLESLVDLNRTSLLVSLLSIIFNPVAWNLVAQNGDQSAIFSRFFLTCRQNTEIKLLPGYLGATPTMVAISSHFSSSRVESSATRCTSRFKKYVGTRIDAHASVTTERCSTSHSTRFFPRHMIPLCPQRSSWSDRPSSSRRRGR